MTPDDFARLSPHLEFVQLPQAYVIVEADAVIEFAYFMETRVGSIVAVSPEGLQVEAGIFGREGMAPTSLIMGGDTSVHRINIQISDDAWRIAKAPFLAVFDQSATLRDLLLRYAQTLIVQTGFTALSNAVHPIDERLARWILMCDDRLEGRDLQLTHEYMSIMLAVRRPSVTTALHVLEGNGLIRAERGCVTVRDRKALELFAGDSYGKPEAEYERLLGPLRSSAAA